MPTVIAILVLSFALGGARLASADERGLEELPVTIQIHDYSHVPVASLGRASRIVSEVYKQIGVRTEWIGIVRPAERRIEPDEVGKGRPHIAQLTIIILTPKMAARGRVVDGVLGFAAVANEGMGRICYVIYDRVRDTAAQAPTGVDDLLAFVMAHEIGHLLLPHGSQSESGLMKGRWAAQEFKQLDVRTLGFSALEARQIRNTIANDKPTLAARAAPSASPAADACVTARNGEREIARSIAEEDQSPVTRRDRNKKDNDRRAVATTDCQPPATPASSSDADRQQAP